jgi:hypothetical protein
MTSPFTPQPQETAQFPTQPPIKSRVVDAGGGARWWTEGWRMFRSSIGTWVGIVLVYFAISLLLNEVPRIGAIADWILTPVFVGGVMLGCEALRREQPLRVSHLFDGFKGPYFIPLLLVGVFNLVACLLAVVVGGAVLAAGIGMSGLLNLANLPTDLWQMWRTLGFTYLLLIALALIVFAGIAMANWFAPALIVLRDERPLRAMMESLSACMRNWLPFLVYGMIGIGIAIAALVAFASLAGVIGFEAVMAIVDGNANWGTFPLGTGVLAAIFAVLTAVIAAVIFGSTFASYRDTLAADDSAPDNLT